MPEEKQKPDAVSEEALEEFLDQASKEMREKDQDAGWEKQSAPPSHRKLNLLVSPDRLEAKLEVVFPATSFEEIQELLRIEGISQGVQEESLIKAVAKADETGRRQKDVLVALGKAAVYIKRMQTSFPFLKDLKDPESGEPLHLASHIFREISEIMLLESIEKIRGYGKPGVAVSPGQTLMEVQGEDVIEPGIDIFGKKIHTIPEATPSSLRPADGVTEKDNLLIASRFGYVSVDERHISVISPIWISSDKMEVYFVNPPQLGTPAYPTPQQVQDDLKASGVCLGIEEKTIAEMCQDLSAGNLRESCVLVARGKKPQVSKGKIGFTFEPLPEIRFEDLQNKLKLPRKDDLETFDLRVPIAHSGALLAEQAEGEDSGPGIDVFGEPVAITEEEQEQKTYKAGINVRREAYEGRIRYISEIYGYPGIIENKITVLSPIWISPDKLEAYFISLPQKDRFVPPRQEEVEQLLEVAHIKYGINKNAIAGISRELPRGEDSEISVLLATGTKPGLGKEGKAELLFKQGPDPGRILEGEKIDFRERDGVSAAQAGQLLAKRTFAEPGTAGADVRGKTLEPPKPEQDLLLPGANVIQKKEGVEQRFYATSGGFAKLSRDTLSVTQKFIVRGDVDYEVGNIKFEGDVEIQGSVKSKFKVEATGDVYVGGTLERRAIVTADGDVSVQGGIIGSRVKAGGGLYAKFIQDSKVDVGKDMIVRNYAQDSEIAVVGRATIQGNEGGSKNLCLLGGTLLGTSGVEANSIGSQTERETKVISGLNLEIESKIKRYMEGLDFDSLRSRQIMRTLMSVCGGRYNTQRLLQIIKESSEEKKKFLLDRLKDMQQLTRLKESLEHHIRELKGKGLEQSKRAKIRVLGIAYPKVTVQIGDLYRQLNEELSSVIFRLNNDEDKVAQEFT